MNPFCTSWGCFTGPDQLKISPPNWFCSWSADFESISINSPETMARTLHNTGPRCIRSHHLQPYAGFILKTTGLQFIHLFGLLLPVTTGGLRGSLGQKRNQERHPRNKTVIYFWLKTKSSEQHITRAKLRPPPAQWSLSYSTLGMYAESPSNERTETDTPNKRQQKPVSKERTNKIIKIQNPSSNKERLDSH